MLNYERISIQKELDNNYIPTVLKYSYEKKSPIQKNNQVITTLKKYIDRFKNFLIPPKRPFKTIRTWLKENLSEAEYNEAEKSWVSTEFWDHIHTDGLTLAIDLGIDSNKMKDKQKWLNMFKAVESLNL